MRQLWWRYWLQLPGLPDIGDPRLADCIAVQAFGRNTYNDADLAGIRTFHDRHGGQDALTLDWLRQHGFDPGQPNRDLARECVHLVDRYHLPVIVQWEVAAAFEPLWYARHRNFIHCLWPSADPTRYYSTWDVKRETVELMRRHRWRRPIEVAHRWQVVRAYAILRRLLGHDPIAVPLRTDSFDPKSVQPWTRSWYAWLPREIAARFHHLLKGWV